MHPKAISLTDLQTRVADYAADCTDAVINTAALQFGADYNFTYKEANPLFGDTVSTSRFCYDAFNQVAARLDAPPRGWLSDDKACPDTLRASLMNQLLALRDPQNMLFRFKGDFTRAVLSDEYTKFDNAQLIDMVAAAVQTMGIDPEIHRAEVGDEMRTYILFPQITFASDPGTKADPDAAPETGGVSSSFLPNHPYGDGGLHPAVYVRNSERGKGAVKLLSAVYRYVCGNGIIWGWRGDESFTFRHRFLSETTMRAVVAEGMVNALRMSETAALNFIQSQEKHVEPVSLKPLVTEWSKKYGLTIEASDNWLAMISGEAMSYGRGNDPRLFDVINAATYTAQQRTNDEREQMERLAGDMLASVYSPRRVTEE